MFFMPVKPVECIAVRDVCLSLPHAPPLSVEPVTPTLDSGLTHISTRSTTPQNTAENPT